MFVTDSNYTSGQLLAASARSAGHNPNACRRSSAQQNATVPSLLGTDPTQDATRQVRGRNFLAKFGQAMYTPRDFTQSALIANDRPYAGWLYLGLGFHVRSVPNPGPDGSRAEEQRLDSLEVNLGVIGPLALARQAQDLDPRRAFRQIPGLVHQLKNELGAVGVRKELMRCRSARTAGWPADPAAAAFCCPARR
jgi:hypothetical protein